MSDAQTGSVLSKFVETSVRENSGTRTSNRYDYQVSWAFCLLLDLQKRSKDYLLVLDYHDDVVVFNSEDNPSDIDFYQVKSRSRKGNWTLKDLLKVSKGKKYSIWGTLYSNKVNFGDSVKSLNIISNASFSLKTKSHPTQAQVLDECTLSDFCWDALKQVAIALQTEHGLQYSPLVDVSTFMKADPLSLKDHKAHAKGKFVEFMEGLGITSYPVSHSFQALIQELQKRNNFEGKISDAESLKKRKAIGRSEFSNLLTKIQNISKEDKWNTIAAQLTACGTDLLTIQKYKREFDAANLQQLDIDNISVSEARKVAEIQINNLLSKGPFTPLSPKLVECAKDILPKLKKLQVPFTESAVIGIILSILSEK